MSPRILSNNMLLTFTVTTLEDYFKSSFVAMLRYSPRKRIFLKSFSLRGAHLVTISEGISSVENEIAAMLSFQNISSVCEHFESLAPKIDLAGTLRKPYRRRKQSLLQMIEFTVRARHDFVHRATLDPSLTDDRMRGLVHDLDAAAWRTYKRMTDYHQWPLLERARHLARRRVSVPANLEGDGSDRSDLASSSSSSAS